MTFSYQQPRYINIVETKASSTLIPSTSSSSNNNLIDIENAPDINYQGKTYEFTNGVILEEKNIERLLSKNTDTLAWLDDNLIDALTFILVKVSKVKLNQVHIFESSKATELFVEKSTAYSPKFKLNNFKYIIGIYNKNSHWHLVFIDNTVKIFYLFDPYKAKQRQLKNNFDHWKEILRNRKEYDEDDNWRCDTYTHPIQTDTYSCGVICLMALEQILLNNEELSLTKTPTINFIIDSSSLYTYREKLYSFILDKCKK